MTRILSVVDSLDLGFHYLNTYFLRHSVKPKAEQVLQNQLLKEDGWELNPHLDSIRSSPDSGVSRTPKTAHNKKALSGSVGYGFLPLQGSRMCFVIRSVTAFN